MSAVRLSMYIDADLNTLLLQTLSISRPEFEKMQKLSKQGLEDSDTHLNYVVLKICVVIFRGRCLSVIGDFYQVLVVSFLNTSCHVLVGKSQFAHYRENIYVVF